MRMCAYELAVGILRVDRHLMTRMAPGLCSALHIPLFECLQSVAAIRLSIHASKHWQNIAAIRLSATVDAGLFALKY
jgi:hypothetical protein